MLLGLTLLSSSALRAAQQTFENPAQGKARKKYFSFKYNSARATNPQGG